MIGSRLLVFAALLALVAMIGCGKTDSRPATDGDQEQSPADGDLDDVDVEPDVTEDGDIEADTEPEAELSDAEPELEPDLEPDIESELEPELEIETEPESPYLPGPIAFRFPLADEQGKYSTDFVFHVDHDPEVHTGVGTAICTNFEGGHFPYCYDEHRGTDYMLQGRFEAMDAEIAFVYTAADGVVLHVEDGHYDRCHIDSENLGPGNISCDGYEMRANYITIEHTGGIVTKYYHLKKNSMLVEEGDTVACGDAIALVGSSGISSAPHLHFQVEDAQGEVIDPFAGEFSQPETYWYQQDGPNGVPAEICP
jgi:hypothetical protein